MKLQTRKCGPALATAVLLAAMVPVVDGQVTDRIQANINHSFMIGNKTLPAGAYTFRILPDSELALMNITSADNKINLQFSVRQAKPAKVPAHSQLVFRKYGDTEVLCKIFQKGADYGSEISETNRQEARLAQQGAPVEHTEDQK